MEQRCHGGVEQVALQDRKTMYSSGNASWIIPLGMLLRVRTRGGGDSGRPDRDFI